jgi:hypothetical protein
VPWNGFPRSIWNWFNVDSDPASEAKALAAAETLRPFTLVVRNGRLRFERWGAGSPPLRFVANSNLGAEVVPCHRQQDEYCEWHVDRDRGAIRRISFTCEGPEYWERMAAIDPDLVAALYREHVSPGVQPGDLFWQADVACFNTDTNRYDRTVFQKGTYNPYNVWNTAQGAMHLTHPANTLGAEINLAADATVLRGSVNPLPGETLPARLICCAAYGGVNRSSDPLIGAGVNALARAGNAVTLSPPVGLYIGHVEIDGLRDPAGAPIPEALRITRASADGSMILRAEVAPPPGAAYTLDRCEFGQRPLTTGGQIARRVTMVLFGLAKSIPGRAGMAAACATKCCANPAAPAFRKLVTPERSCTGLSRSDWEEDRPTTLADPAPPGAPLAAIPVPGPTVPFAPVGAVLPRPLSRALL